MTKETSLEPWKNQAIINGAIGMILLDKKIITDEEWEYYHDKAEKIFTAYHERLLEENIGHLKSENPLAYDSIKRTIEKELGA